MSRRLPIIPLKTVLFPGGEFILRLYEPRYLRLLEDCLRTKQPFGVVYCHDHGDELATLAATGCTAHITECSPYEDGTYVVRIEGGERFRVQQVLEGEATEYYQVLIEPISEDIDLAADDPIHESILQMLDIYRDLLSEVNPDLVDEMPENLSAVDLAYLALSQVTVDEKVRLQVLELRSYRERHELCLKVLRKEIQTLRFLMDESDDEMPPMGHVN